MTTPVMSMPEIAQAQGDKYITHNEALRYLDALWNRTALSIGDTTPPVSPSDGDVYIIADTSPTGDWTGKEDNVTFYFQQWYFIAPVEGMEFYVQDIDTRYEYDGAAWVTTSGGVIVQNEGSPTVSSEFDTILFQGAGVDVSDQGGGTVAVTIEGGGGGGSLTIIYEGASPTINDTFTQLTFEGAGVTVTDDGGGAATIDIPGGGGGATSYSDESTTTTLTGNSKSIADTSSAAVAYTLPTGVNGEFVRVVDGADNAATNNITLTPQSGESVEGVVDDTAVIDVDGGSLELVYSTVDSRGWIVADSASATQGSSTFSGCSLGLGTNQTITTATTTAVDWDTVVYDTDDFVALNGSPDVSTVVIPTTGYYLLTVTIRWGSNGTGTRRVFLDIAGTAADVSNIIDTGNATLHCNNLSTVRYLTAGDEVAVSVYQDSGGNLDVTSANENTMFTVSKVG